MGISQQGLIQSYKHVCIKCRTVAKSRGANPLCPRCGGVPVNMGHDFRAPKKTDDAGWDRVARWVRAIRRAIGLTGEERKHLAREGMFKK